MPCAAVLAIRTRFGLEGLPLICKCDEAEKYCLDCVAKCTIEYNDATLRKSHLLHLVICCSNSNDTKKLTHLLSSTLGRYCHNDLNGVHIVCRDIKYA